MMKCEICGKEMISGLIMHRKKKHPEAPVPVEQKKEVVLEKEIKPELKAVSTEPEVKLEKDEMLTIIIDRQMTDGGIRVNGKLYVGKVTVPREQAEDLLRIQEEYYETKKKLLDPNVRVRMKNDFQKEALFLADPKENSMKRNWTRDYGLLPPEEWALCTPKFKEHLLEMRRSFYGY